MRTYMVPRARLRELGPRWQEGSVLRAFGKDSPTREELLPGTSPGGAPGWRLRDRK
jgi:hypothetical protein